MLPEVLQCISMIPLVPLSQNYLHGEQSCSIAAEAYSRITNKPALLSVTAGPGSINA